MSGFGTQLLDVAIGLMFTYVVVSLIASAMVEALETLLRTRAKYLWQGLGELLNDPATRVPLMSDGIKDRKSPSLSVATLYQHPIISALFYGNYDGACRRLALRRLPTYIPRESFSTAVIDIVSRQHPSQQKPGRTKPIGLSSMEMLRRGIRAMPKSSQVRLVLESMARLAGDDVALMQRRLEAWYDTSMDSIAGWYKGHAQLMLLVVGFALAAGGNVDSWRIARDLAIDEPKRQALVDSASEFVAGHNKDGFPLTSKELGDYFGAVEGSALPSWDTVDRFSVFGWLITAFAVSLGAPFWFDLLNKFMVVRSTVKPKEKSQDEGSEDRAAAGPRTGTAPAARVFFQ
jgi:hypothetical protein